MCSVLLQAASRHYDAVIDTDPHSWTSGFMTRLMRAPLKIGYDADHHVLYSSNCTQGFWRVVTR